MRIRPAVSADTDAILELARQFIVTSSYRHFLTFNPAQLRVFVDFVMARGLLLVAETADGRVVGMIAGVWGDDPIGGVRMLDELVWWVELEYRSGRAGLKLWGAYEEWARQNGVEALTMKAPHGSDVGRFYERLGFEAVETVYFKRLGVDGTGDRTAAGRAAGQRVADDEEDRPADR